MGCEHRTDAQIEVHARSMSNIAMNAPYRTCPCCRGGYFYTDAAYMSTDRDGTPHSGGRSHTLNCDNCGGHYVQWGEPFGSVSA